MLYSENSAEVVERLSKLPREALIDIAIDLYRLEVGLIDGQPLDVAAFEERIRPVLDAQKMDEPGIYSKDGWRRSGEAMRLDARHGFRDAKGREMGHRATIWPRDGRFEVQVRSTRNGEIFGAIPRNGYETADTLEAAQRRAEQRIREGFARVAALTNSGVYPR